MQLRLETNPFFILGLPLSASQQDVVEACEDRTSDHPADEARFTEARQALLTPRARLMAEIGFLPDTPDGEVRRLIQVMSTPGSDLDAVRASARRLSPLSRSNVLTWLSTRRRPDAEFMVDLNGAQAQIDHQALLAAFERAHASAGIAPATPEVLRQSVLQHFEQQNVVVTQTIEDPNLLAEIVGATTRRILTLGEAERADRLDSLLQAYWRAVSRETSDIRRFLEKCGADIMANPSDDESVESYIASLERWDRFGDPLQVFERAKGREDREAQSLLFMVRRLCIDLSNDKSRSDIAYRIGKRACEVFAELERSIAQLAGDVEQLKAKMAFESCAALERQADAARRMPGAFAAALKRLAGSAYSDGPPGELLRELDAVLSRHPAPFDHPFIIVRNLAIDLLDATKESAATRVLLRELSKATRVKSASAEAKQRLEKDLRDLDRFDLEAELKRAFDAKDWSKAEAVVAKLLLLAETGEARSDLTQLQSRIRGKQASGRGRLAFWLAVGAALAIWVIVASDHRSRQASYAPPPASTSPASSQPEPGPQPAPAPPPPPVSPDDFTERMPGKITPAMGANGPRRSIAEIRYCKFEKVRLEKIRSQISPVSPDVVIDLFNAGIDDLNDRCSRYSYRPGDLQIVERQANARESRLAAEAETRLAAWRSKIPQAAPPVAAAPTGFLEIKPGPAPSATYSLENVRYCLYQEARLNAAERQIADAFLMIALRGALDEWNSLCQRFAHRTQDMSMIRTEVAVRSSILQQEGASLVAAWRASAPPAWRPAQPERPITADLLVAEEARRVQVRLAELGFFKGPANGAWGPASRSAMRAFNSFNGLGDTDAAETANLTRLFAPTAARATANAPVLPPAFAEATFPPPAGASLHPLNKNDAIRIHGRLRELRFYLGKNDTLWSGASRVALRAFKQRAGLPADDVWDGSTETALFRAPADPKAAADKEFDDNISGRWSTEPQNCQRTRVGQALPIVITRNRASVNDQGCDFLERQGGGASWTIRASCRVDAETWIANVRLSRSGDSLTWSSERGVTVYRRCPT